MVDKDDSLYGMAKRIDERTENIENNMNQKLKSQDDAINHLHEELENLKFNYKSTTKNRQNLNFSLLEFIKNSKKEYFFFDTEEEFIKKRRKYIGIMLSIIIVNIITLIISSATFGYLSTFSVVEMIWSIILLTYVFKTLGIYSKMNHTELAYKSEYEYLMNKENTYINTFKVNKYNKIFKKLFFISIVANIMCVWLLGKNIALNFIDTILEIALFALGIIHYLVRNDFYFDFQCCMISGYDLEGTEIILVYVPFEKQKIVTFDEFRSSHKWLFP